MNREKIKIIDSSAIRNHAKEAILEADDLWPSSIGQGHHKITVWLAIIYDMAILCHCFLQSMQDESRPLMPPAHIFDSCPA